MALRTVGVRLTAEIGEYQNKLRAAAQTTKDFKGELDKASKKGSIDKVADNAAIAGVGLLGLAAVAVKSAADFDKSMSAVAAATHAPKAEIDQLRAAAIQAGKDTQYSATEAADGITELSKAGVSTASILGGGLKGALSLAAAGQLSVGEAAETAASAMTQFKLSGDQVPHVADLLAAAAGKAQGSVHDMGYALNQSGLVAAQFGLSIEDTTGALAEFASAGLTGSDAGTSLKTMLLAIANPSKQTQTLMDELGISFYDATGKFIGMNGVAQVLQTRLHGLSDATRQQALGQIFGNDAIRSASILYTDGAAGVDKWKNAVNDSGYAAQTASKLTDNLSGDMERLKGSIETLFIESGSGANGGLRVLAKVLNEVVDQIGNINPAVSGTLVVLAGLAGALLIGGAAWVKYKKIVQDVQDQLAATGPAGEKAAAALEKTRSAAAKSAVAFVALEAATMVLDSFGPKAANVDRLTASLTNLANTGKMSGELTDAFGGDLKRLNDDAGVATSGVIKFMDTVEGHVPVLGDAAKAATKLGANLAGKDDYNTALQNFANLDQAMSTSMTTINDYNKASQLWQTVLTKSGLDTQKLAELLPNTYKELQKESAASEQSSGSLNKYSGSAAAAKSKLGDLNSALQVGKDAQQKYATEADAVAGAARGERDAIKALHDVLKAETDPVFALIDAQKKLKDAQSAYTKAVKEHGKNSKEAKEADIASAQAALGLQDAVGGLAGSFNGKLDPAFRKTLQNAGLTKAQIRDVERQFAAAKKSADKYTGDYRGKVSAPGATQAKKDIDRAYAAGKQYDGTYIARLSINGESQVSAKLDALLVKQRALQTGLSVSSARAAVQKDLDRNRQHAYATGGQVGGWSPHSRADNIPAWLTAGEFVHPVDSVKYYGPQVMTAIQHRQMPRELLTAFASGKLGQMGDLPADTPVALASGGQVPWRFVTNASKTKIPSWSEVLSHIPGGEAASWLRAQNGKPYIWASAGPNGYDCSGIVSAVYNLLHGRNPYSHTFSTGSLPGGWFTKPGIGGPLTAAWSNPGEAPASSTTGHMMGMAGGLTFESTGSRGVHLGSTTRRLTDFAHIAHYAQGGHVAMANGGTITEPVYGIGASGRTYSFGEDYKPEKVTPMWQTGGHGAGGGTTTINLTVNAAVGSHPREVGAAVVQTIGAYIQGGGELRVQGRKVF